MGDCHKSESQNSYNEQIYRRCCHDDEKKVKILWIAGRDDGSRCRQATEKRALETKGLSVPDYMLLELSSG